jgi:hypothetical protein
VGLGPNSEDGGGGDVGRRRVVARVSLTGGVFLSLYFFFLAFFCVCVLGGSWLAWPGWVPAQPIVLVPRLVNAQMDTRKPDTASSTQNSVCLALTWHHRKG